MELFRLLKKDHERILALLEKVHSLPPERQSRLVALSGELQEEVDFHLGVEERLVYPRLAHIKELQPIILAVKGQHRRIRRLLANQSSKPAMCSAPSLANLLRQLALHLEEEEELFDEAAELVEDKLLREIARDVSGLKRERIAAN